MRLTPDRQGIIVNDSLTLLGIPARAFEYRLGTRSAIEWLLDQYVAENDEPPVDDNQYLIRLIAQVLTVSEQNGRSHRAVAGEVRYLNTDNSRTIAIRAHGVAHFPPTRQKH